MVHSDGPEAHCVARPAHPDTPRAHQVGMPRMTFLSRDLVRSLLLGVMPGSAAMASTLVADEARVAAAPAANVSGLGW